MCCFSSAAHGGGKEGDGRSDEDGGGEGDGGHLEEPSLRVHLLGDGDERGVEAEDDVEREGRAADGEGEGAGGEGHRAGAEDAEVAEVSEGREEEEAPQARGGVCEGCE